MTSIETIYDGIKDYIEKNLESLLDTSDEITTPMFENIMRNSTYDILSLKIYPSLMFETGRVEVARETTSSDRYILPITFYCISMGGDTEQLEIKSERYVWALKTLFEQDPTCGGIIDEIDIQGFEFSPSLKRQQTFVHIGLLYTSFEILITRS